MPKRTYFILMNFFYTKLSGSSAIHLSDKIAFSGNNRFNSLPKTFACPNQMILVHMRHYSGNSCSEGVKRVMEMFIGRPFNNAPYEVT